MATIKRYGKDEKNVIVSFELSNGRKYFVADGFLFLSIKKEMTFEELMSVARLYTWKGAKIITNRIWKEFGVANEHLNGGHIVHSSSNTTEHIKRYCYNYNGKKLVNII